MMSGKGDATQGRCVREDLLAGIPIRSTLCALSVPRMLLGGLVWLVALGGAVVFFAIPAQAALTHPYTGTSFGPCGVAPSSCAASASDTFSNPQSVAVDQSTGDVYVYDAGEGGRVYKFNDAGEPADFEASHTNVIEGVGGAGNGENEIAVDGSPGPTEGDIYVANNSEVRIYNAAGEPFPEALTGGEACGVAVGASGDVYVGFYSETVKRYVPVANPVTNADETGSMGGLDGICNVAVNGEGNVYAATYNGGVNKYASLQFGSLAATGTLLDEHGSTLALDPSSNELYVNQTNGVAQFNPADEQDGSFGEQDGPFASAGPGVISGSYGIAVDGGTHDVFVSSGTGQVSVFGPAVVVPTVKTGAAGELHATSAMLNGEVDPDAVRVTSCVFEYGLSTSYGQSVPCSALPGSGNAYAAVSAAIVGLTPDSVYHYRLVATNANGTTPGEDGTFATTGPGIVSEGVTNVGFESATMEAELDPDGGETTYHFEYGATGAYGTSVPSPDESIGAGQADVEVEIRLPGLQPSTTYHFRVVATNAQATVDGAERTFTTQGAGTPFQLPDNRAYEMVSPPNKNGGDIRLPTTVRPPGGIAIPAQSSTDGNKVEYASTSAFGDGIKSAPLESYYIASRGEHGWNSEPIDPEQPSSSRPHTLEGPQFVWFSPELSNAIFFTPSTIADSLIEESSFTPFGQGNLLVYNAASGHFNSLSPANTPLPEGFEEPPTSPALAGVSADDNRVIFAYNGSLTSSSTNEEYRINLYLWTRGKGFRLVNILPGGHAPDPDMELNAGFGSGNVNQAGGGNSYGGEELTHAISMTGKRIFWTDSLGRLYMREYATRDGEETEQSYQVDASQGGPGSGGGGHFWAASADGSRVFFTDPNKLTPNSTAEPTGGACKKHGDIYEYRTDSEGPGVLTDLTTADPAGACIYGVSAVSEDGSYVYFVAGGKLTKTAEEGKPNLYVLHDPNGEKAELKLIATLDPADEMVWQGNEIGEYSGGIEDRRIAITPDGSHFLFQSRKSLTGYDNRIATFHPGAGRCEEPNAESEIPCEEIFLYDASTSVLSCVSCNSSGSRPLGESYVNGAHNKLYYPRYLSDDGNRVFFNSNDSLVPQDTNGHQDVYEWERRGIGSCPLSGAGLGCIFLISTGTGAFDSTFAEASPDGSDVFFTTRQQLVPQDQDEDVNLYDARENGASELISPPVCSGTGCQGLPSAPPIFATPSSVTFAGVGNFPPVPKAVAKPKKKKKHKPAKRKKPGKHRNGKKVKRQIKRGRK